MLDDVVITGLGVISPIGANAAEFWDALVNGRSGAAPVVGFDTSPLPRRVACQVQTPVDGGCTGGRATALALAAARQAMANACADSGAIRGARKAVIIGTTMGETEFIEAGLDVPDSDWLDEAHRARITAAGAGCISMAVAQHLQWPGPALDLYGACAAGNMALASARRMLLAGECDAVLAGGADGFSRLAFIGFMRARVLAAEVCRPFDKRRDGLLVGEGAAMFLLERASDARARGAKPRARVLGAGLACEDYHPTRPHPEGDGLRRATTIALAEAGVRPGEVDYVCAHGTGTPQNDQIEVEVLGTCFPPSVPFSSIKALTGHMMGAASAAEAVACVLSLENSTIVPTWTLEHVLEPCALDAVRGAPRQAALRIVVNNSAGFGGYNSSVVLGAA